MCLLSVQGVVSKRARHFGKWVNSEYFSLELIVYFDSQPLLCKIKSSFIKLGSILQLRIGHCFCLDKFRRGKSC